MGKTIHITRWENTSEAPLARKRSISVSFWSEYAIGDALVRHKQHIRTVKSRWTREILRFGKPARCMVDLVGIEIEKRGGRVDVGTKGDKSLFCSYKRDGRDRNNVGWIGR